MDILHFFFGGKVVNNLEKEALGFSILIGILLLFILYVYIQSWRSFRNKEDNRFNENLYQYRKTLYFFYLYYV